MHHFFVEQPVEMQGTDADSLAEGQRQNLTAITGPDVNHIKNVLRMKTGEELLVSDGTGADYLCRIVSIEAGCVLVQVLKREEESRELTARITLYQGLPKGDKMELIIQKAVELGVSRIVPVMTKNTVVRLDQKKEESKRKRWQAIAESAAKQSKRSLIPEVGPVLPLAEALKEASAGDVGLFAYENQKGMAGTKQELLKIGAGQEIALFIGPEGGFDREEVEKAEAAGLRPVSLGKRILRTETAGLALLSVLMFWLEMDEENRD